MRKYGWSEAEKSTLFSVLLKTSNRDCVRKLIQETKFHLGKDDATVGVGIYKQDLVGSSS